MSEVAVLRAPPNSMEAERSLLGAMILKPGLVRTIEIERDDFYRTDHKIIFDALQACEAAGKAIDFVTVAEQLEAMGELENIGGMVYLANIQESTPTASNATTYAGIIRDKAKLRAGIQIGHDIAQAGFDGDAKAMADAMSDCLLAAAGRDTRDHWSTDDSLKYTLEHIDLVHTGKIRPGLRFGIRELDDKYPGGMRPGQMIILGARPSMGKTAVMMNIAEAQDCPVGIISLEMEHDELMIRRIAMAAEVNYTKIETAKMTSEEWGRFSKGVSGLRKHMHICDRGGMSIAEVEREATRMKHQHNIGILMVDYLQLIEGNGNNRTEEIGHVSRKIKALSKRLKVPIVALAQLNRNLENRPADKRRPNMADLRESGQIEQDAHMIIFLYRDAIYNDVPDNEMEFIVDKCRNGRLGICKARWVPELMQLRDII